MVRAEQSVPKLKNIIIQQNYNVLFLLFFLSVLAYIFYQRCSLQCIYESVSPYGMSYIRNFVGYGFLLSLFSSSVSSLFICGICTFLTISGTWSAFSDDVMEEQAEAIIAAAYEAGINLFDLSEAHSGEKCETILGKILKKKAWKRSSYIIVTKIYWHSR